MRISNTKFQRIKYILLLPILFLGLSLTCSCRQEPDKIVHVSKLKFVTYKLAVVLPLNKNSDYGVHFDYTLNWARETFISAQQTSLAYGDSVRIDFDIEYYDEDSVNVAELAPQLANRDDLLLIIGPLSNEHVDIMAQACQKTKKTLIVPAATSEDIVRRYAVKKSGDKASEPFLWSLCETDVTQSNVIVSRAWEIGAQTIGLLTPDNDYGSTFYNWVPFFAENYKLSLTTEHITKYTHSDIASKAKTLFQSGCDCVICAVENADEAKIILQLKQQMGSDAPRLLFTNGAYTNHLLELGDLAEGVEGVAPYINPTTGFKTTYEQHFETTPLAGEAQVYDAMMLAGFAAYARYFWTDEADKSVNELLKSITSSKEGLPTIGWNEIGMSAILSSLAYGSTMLLKGASGLLQFDEEAYTSLIQSTYVHWMVYEGKYVSLNYLTTNGGGHTTSPSASWNSKSDIYDEIADEDAPVEYFTQDNSYAVLIQGSSGWKNYRHQADVLNMYQMLKRNGWDDDHIILILSNDIAYNDKNTYRGMVKISDDGPDLYQSAKIDYDTDTLTIDDLKKILLGKKSTHLPKVLEHAYNANILIFWSGHGCTESDKGANAFLWRDDKTLFTDDDLEDVLCNMDFRKILLLLEPCFSRNMAQAANGLPGVLAISAAGSTESSFADFHSPELGVWMSDRFTNNLVNTLSDSPNQTYNNLYQYLCRHTLGSHVYVENASMFGNLYRQSPYEFLIQIKGNY